MKFIIALAMSLMLVARINAASTNEVFGLRSMVHLVADARAQVIKATESGETQDFHKLYKMSERFTDECVLSLSLDELSVDQRLGVSNTLKNLRVIVGHAKKKLDNLREDNFNRIEELETPNPELKQDLSELGRAASHGKELLIRQLQKDATQSAQLSGNLGLLIKTLDEQIQRFSQ